MAWLTQSVKRVYRNVGQFRICGKEKVDCRYCGNLGWKHNRRNELLYVKWMVSYLVLLVLHFNNFRLELNSYSFWLDINIYKCEWVYMLLH